MMNIVLLNTQKHKTFIVRTLSLVFLCLFFNSCNSERQYSNKEAAEQTQASDTSVPLEKSAGFDFARIVNSENPRLHHWLGFYQAIFPDFSLDSMVLDLTFETEKVKGNVFPVGHENFNPVFLPFLIFNADSSKYIDMVSYSWVVHEDSQVDFAADQAVNLVSIGQDTNVIRIAFFGPSHWVEEAFWLDDRAVVLLTADDLGKLGVMVIDLLKMQSHYFHDRSNLVCLVHPGYAERQMMKAGLKIEE